MLVPREDVRQFKSPKASIGTLDAEMAAAMITAACDLALIIDLDGVIVDLAVGNGDLAHAGCDSWIGQRWIDLVTIESQPKITSILTSAHEKVLSRWRQVNHPNEDGADLPISYTAMPVGTEGHVIAVGRDMRSMANLQQRLMDTQQSMEREYIRLRHAETRYRLLFQMAGEAVLIVDADSMKVVDANPSAAELLADHPKEIVGRSLRQFFHSDSAFPLENMLGGVAATGRTSELLLHLLQEGPSGTEMLLSASLFRQANTPLFLISLRPSGDAGTAGTSLKRSPLADVVEGIPDGFVVTGMDRRILAANRAFLDLAELPTESMALGEPLDGWLGQSEVDLNVLVANLREHGSVNRFSTVMRGHHGSSELIELSAVITSFGDDQCMGFAIRSVGPRASRGTLQPLTLPRSVEQLTELVGRVPLKDLVRDTTDVIERMCIEAALELTKDNRASAAEMLGLSRQS
ncbi:MAG: transcriptional regulator PpsR, partial [Pseudomonadota bacterium]